MTIRVCTWWNSKGCEDPLLCNNNQKKRTVYISSNNTYKRKKNKSRIISKPTGKFKHSDRVEFCDLNKVLFFSKSWYIVVYLTDKITLLETLSVSFLQQTEHFITNNQNL